MGTRSARVIGAVVAVLVAAACLGGNSAPPADAESGTGPPSSDQGGATIFADEFSGPALDREKWTVYTGTVYNNELQVYVDGTSVVYIAHGDAAAGATDGALVIQAHEDPDGAPRFTSGRLHGRVLFRYGTATARIKLPAGAGFWPAFWLLGGGPWPSHGEIDVMESVGDATWVSAALHGPGYSGDTPLVHRTTLPDSLDITAWHEYAVTWTADSIVFRVDGSPVYRVMREQVAQYGPAAALDSAKYVVLNLALGGVYPAAVNGVTTPLLGLPESTLPLIRRGEARMLVDWVRVTP
ncbi:MAG TPA: glycoside hydrolase family 16 protein [Gemmatimonadaceae bacterium]|nr:glycoside hydrolase family 16 protein [Gemmatimonadaceae bacterium]